MIPDHPDGVHKKITPEIADRVWDLFVNQGVSLNHTVFLLDYEYKIDDVSESIRSKIKELLLIPHKTYMAEEAIEEAKSRHPDCAHAETYSGLTASFRTSWVVKLWRNLECYLAEDPPKYVEEGFLSRTERGE